MAKTDAKLWSLDRPTFNHIVKDSASKRREKYEEFLKSVKILSSMDHYERSKLPDALKNYEFKAGDYIINQGDSGNQFFMIIDGEAVATKSINGQAPQEVMQYKVGDYFGELALLKNEPRAANVIAKVSVCFTVDEREGSGVGSPQLQAAVGASGGDFEAEYGQLQELLLISN